MFERHPCTKTSLHEIARFIEDATSGAKIETEMRIVDGHGRIQDMPLELEKYSTTFTREEVYSLTCQVYLTIGLATHGIRSLATICFDAI
jgi:hypothetical protein